MEPGARIKGALQSYEEKRVSDSKKEMLKLPASVQ